MIKIECDAVLFDLDGVLIDSTACITRHWQQWAQRHKLDLDEIMKVAHGMRTIETIRLSAPHLNAEEEAGWFAASEVVDTAGVNIITGASRLVSFLPSDGWAIVTSGTKDVATARLTCVGLPLPPVFVTADDVTRGKPNPEPYLVAANILNVSPNNCVVIEDSPAGIEAASLAGMKSVAVSSTHARPSLKKATTIVNRLADIQIFRSETERRLTIQLSQ